MSEALVQAISEMQEDEALQFTKDLLAGGTPPLDVLEDCRKAMEIVGQRFEQGEYFVPELILAGEILREISDEVKPYLGQGSAPKKIGKVVLGTVQGDIHDIGKNIVNFMLDANGFEVIDLGVDVPPEQFVTAAQQNGASIVALSGFLTLAYDPMKATTAALRQAIPGVKVMIGGGQIDEHVRDYTGADAFGHDAMAAVALAKQWMPAA